MIRYAERGCCITPPAERAGSGDDIERVARLQPTPSATAFPPSPRRKPGLSSSQEPNRCRICGTRYVVDSLARDCEVRHMADLIRVTDGTPKREIADLLLMACADTKRLPRIIERFTTNPPSEWSDAHAFLNELLDDWQNAPA